MSFWQSFGAFTAVTGVVVDGSRQLQWRLPLHNQPLTCQYSAVAVTHALWHYGCRKSGLPMQLYHLALPSSMAPSSSDPCLSHGMMFKGSATNELKPFIDTKGSITTSTKTKARREHRQLSQPRPFTFFLSYPSFLSPLVQSLL